MWFRRLTFKNASRFPDFDIELKHGSVGVFGKNGEGKSTLLNFMYAIPTNDFGRFDGVKIDCIRNTVAKGEESWIYGEIVHGEHVLKIKRYLRPVGKTTTEVVVDDGKPITDANQAQEKIDEVLGVDKQMLNLYAFKTQDKIYDFMTTTPADRAKAFAVLCRTEKCEDLWNMLGTFLNKDTEVNQVITDNSDEIIGIIAEHKAKVTELEASIETEKAALLNAKSEESAREILRKQDRLEDLMGQQTKAEARIQTLTEELESAEENVRKRKKKGEALKADVDAKQEATDDAAAALKGWEQYKKYKSRRKELKEEAEALADEEKNRKPPKQPEDYGKVGIEKLKKGLAGMEGELVRAKAVLDQFEKTKGVTNCPTCNTPVPAIGAYLTEMRMVVSGHPAQIDALSARIDAIEAYDALVRKHENWRAGYDARVKANQDSRDALKDITAPEGDAEELAKTVKEFKDLVAELEECREVYRRRVEVRDTAKANLQTAEERLAEVKQGIAENTETEEKVERARKRLEEHITACNNISGIRGELKGITSQVEEKEEELKKLRAKLKRTKKVRKMVAILEQARDVFHRDTLPRRVAQINLGRMEGDINEGLGFFGDPYWVESDENLTFIAHKPGEPPQAAGRLSTGQKVVLALSFWPAVASLWQTDLGMLCLDEPTANLDEDNRQFLSQALGTLTAKVRGRRQLVMVTHDPNLESSFDQVIKLGAPSA